MTEQELAIKEETTLAPMHEASAFSNMQNFEGALRMGNMLSKSSMVPQQYQNNVPNCVIAIEMANRIGASVFAVMQNLAIVHGKPAWEAKFIIAAINSCGRFSPLRFEMIGEENTDSWGCYGWTYDKRNNEKLTGPTITIATTKAEGWYQKAGSKWKTLPDLMLRYRAASFFGKLYAPDVLMGMQTAEEMHDIYEAQASTSGPAKVYAVNTQTGEISRTASVRDKLKRKATIAQNQPPLAQAVEVESNPELVTAILNAIESSVSDEDLLEAEDLIRELEHPEDKAKCQQALEHKRKVMARSQPV